MKVHSKIHSPLSKIFSNSVEGNEWHLIDKQEAEAA